MKLAEKAIQELNLDYIFFIIWPFHYIEGFHSKDMKEWIKKQKHYDWDIRVSLLEKELLRKDKNYSKIKILYEAKEWYIESKNQFDAVDHHSYFWTGSWFVIRKLQSAISSAYNYEEEFSFFFVVGTDQFNPNVYSLIDTKNAKEKVWLDYSIEEQLALHNVFVAQREEQEFFVPPVETKNKIHFSNKLVHGNIQGQVIVIALITTITD